MADICVRAVNAVGVIEDDERLVDLSDIKVEKRQGGSIKDSSLIDGIFSTRSVFMPACLEAFPMRKSPW